MKYLLLLLLSIPAHAGTEFASVGMGRKVLSNEPFERFASVGWKTDGEAQLRTEGGFYLDYANKNPVTWFGSVTGGYELQTGGGAYLSGFFGPAAISQTDEKLGSHFQFETDFGVGVKRASGKALGFHFRHLSNAGIWQPNIGRDLLAVQLQF